MSNLNEKDIAEYNGPKIRPVYRCEDCDWQLLVTIEGEKVWVNIPIIDVPVENLLEEWDTLSRELALKKDALNKTTWKYKEKAFNIKFVDDINFKELYGKANDDVRKYHAEKECKDLIQHKEHLEICIKYLENYLNLLNHLIYYKQKR